MKRNFSQLDFDGVPGAGEERAAMGAQRCEVDGLICGVNAGLLTEGERHSLDFVFVFAGVESRGNDGVGNLTACADTPIDGETEGDLERT